MAETTTEKNDYRVRLDVFEGPLDLLLYLVSRSEVEITDINISAITRQYLEYLDLMREVNIDLAAEYLHMAATLLRLKARELLPYDQQPESLGLEEDGGIYNREQLIQQLLEYKKFKEAAGSFKVYEAEQIGTFGRGCPDEPPAEGAGAGRIIGNVTLFDLVAAFRGVLTREVPEDPSHVVSLDEPRIDDRIERVIVRLTEQAEVRFEELFADDRRRIVMVATFMAILELVKMQHIRFRQEERFGAIFVSLRPENERDAPLPDDEDAPQAGTSATGESTPSAQPAAEAAPAQQRASRATRIKREIPEPVPAPAAEVTDKKPDDPIQDEGGP
jgi:segregation and condensation protein A